MEAGDAVRPGVAFAPDPERGTVTGALRSAPEMTSEPLDALLFAGEKATVRLAELPAARLVVPDQYESAKPEPETRGC